MPAYTEQSYLFSNKSFVLRSVSLLDSEISNERACHRQNQKREQAMPQGIHCIQEAFTLQLVLDFKES